MIQYVVRPPVALERNTIRKINLTSRELFRDAFTHVMSISGEIFSSLFGGGTARMQVLDELVPDK